VTFHGELVIKNPELFAERLAKGVGRHAAYGYGMLLLRPSRR
jgi:CRISPR system Cascade subunit CasE